MAVVPRVSSPTFVGRSDELRALRDVLDGVRAGDSACVVVAGEAGLGKTRLVAELAQGADGVDVLTGGCVEVGVDVLPYAPFVEILADLAEREGAGAVRALAGATGDELGRLLPALDPAGSPDFTRASGSRLYAALSSLVAGLAGRAPLLLVVEDLHWSDRATRDLLALLARRLPRRTLLLLTVRTDEEQLPLPRFLAQLRIAARRIQLAPLSRQEQALQLSGIVGVPPSPARLAHVYGRAEGNPFFAEEIVALGDAHDDVPETVRGLLEARLVALPASTRRVVRAAAAAGRRVEHGVLARAVDLADSALDDAVRPAIDASVLLLDGAEYRFRHALLHETVQSTLLPGERLRLHRRLAEALTAEPDLAASTHGLAGRIAHHWLAAGELTRGRRASYDAAREAAKTLAFDEALRHYERVLALPGDDDELPVARYRLLWDAAEVAHLAGAGARAADLVQEALACVDPDQRHHHAYLHERLGRYLWMAAEGQRAVAAYRRAVELVPDDPVTNWQAAITSGYAQVLMLSGWFAEARVQAERAIALARQVPDGRSTEGHARNNLGAALAHLGEVDRGIAELQEAARIAQEEFVDVDEIARAIVNLHSVLYDAGRYAEALEVARHGIAVVDQLGLQRRKGTWCRCDAVDALIALGRYDEAQALLDEAEGVDPGGIDRVRLQAMRGLLALRRGSLAAAGDLLRDALDRGRSIVDGHLVLPVHRALVETLRGQGDPAAAVAHSEEVLRGTWGEGDGAYLVHLLAAAAGAAADAAVRARAERRPDEAREWADRSAELAAAADTKLRSVPAPLPPAAAARSWAHAEAERGAGRADAERWAEVADRWAVMGEIHQAGWARLREAEAHLTHRHRAPAATALRRAPAAAADLGAEHLRAAVDGVAARSRLALEEPARLPPQRYRLSARESDVLVLVARGLTDRQIGEELFISHRTVERHVSSILAKLDARTRAEAASIAHRDGLLPVP